MGIKFLMQKDNMITKIFSKLILIMVFFVTSPRIIASASSSISADSSVSKNELSKHFVEKYFKKFATSAETDYVKYANKTRKLILLAHPKAMKDFINAFYSLLVALLGTAFAGGSLLFFVKGDLLCLLVCIVICALCLWGFIAMWKDIIENYKMRNSFKPYLTFDSKGLQEFDEYKLEWKDVDRVNFDVISSIYLDKAGKKLFRFYVSDKLIPVSYEQVKWIFKHCLSKYGDEKFKVVHP